MERNEGETRKTEITDMGAEKPCFPDTGERSEMNTSHWWQERERFGVEGSKAEITWTMLGNTIHLFTEEWAELTAISASVLSFPSQGGALLWKLTLSCLCPQGFWQAQASFHFFTNDTQSCMPTVGFSGTVLGLGASSQTQSSCITECNLSVGETHF